MFVYLERKRFLLASFAKAVDLLFKKLEPSQKSLIVLPCSLHDLALQSNSAEKFYQEVDCCTCDSMFLTYFFRFKYKMKIDRVYGPDLMTSILSRAQNSAIKGKHFFLSPSLEASEKITKILTKSYSKVDAKFGFLPKKISREKEENVLEQIVSSQPNFVWLGIGSPKQIQLASYLKKHAKGIKIFCVGAAFDFLTGQKKQAPILMQRYSLEWLFRLLSEPARLWRRYLITIPLYLGSILWRKIAHSGLK